MPWKLKAPCRVPGCPNVATNRGYCDKHQSKIPPRQFTTRPNAAGRGYDYKWQKFRAEYLRRNPICADCGQQATDVHHPWRLEDGGPQYDAANLMPLCHPCHSARTAREK